MPRSIRWEAALGASVVIAVLAATSSGCEKKADAASGRDLFANTCARCHGMEGAGGPPAFAGGPSPRNFRDHAFHGERTDEQLKLTIVNGKGAAMPAFGTMFSEAQLQALVAHVRSFDPQRTGP
ncbi:MAG: exported protein of unknown function [Labilithrix sp.]|nr:exported protein of unknown function [Labilithrix sp.]